MKKNNVMSFSEMMERNEQLGKASRMKNQIITVLVYTNLIMVITLSLLILN